MSAGRHGSNGMRGTLIALQTAGGCMLHTAVLTRISLLVMLGLTTAGCELVGGIFKAGMWIGALGVIAIVVLLVVVMGKLKR